MYAPERNALRGVPVIAPTGPRLALSRVFTHDVAIDEFVDEQLIFSTAGRREASP